MTDVDFLIFAVGSGSLLGSTTTELSAPESSDRSLMSDTSSAVELEMSLVTASCRPSSRELSSGEKKYKWASPQG